MGKVRWRSGLICVGVWVRLMWGMVYCTSDVLCCVVCGNRPELWTSVDNVGCLVLE